MLTFRGARVLVALEHVMEDASRAMPAPAAGAAADARPAADSRTGPFAQAGGQQGPTRGDCPARSCSLCG
jgi:hypothetical protein